MVSNSIIDLADTLSANTKKYHTYLIEHQLPLPSFNPVVNNVQLELPDEISKAREAAIVASHEIHTLLLGPLGPLLDTPSQSTRLIVLDFLNTHKIGMKLGANERTTFKDIALDHDLDEEDTTRMLRLAMTHRIFTEPEIGVVAHTAASYAYATDPLLANLVAVYMREIWPSLLRVTEAMKRWPGSTDPAETGFGLANNTKDSPFVVWERDPPRAEQFANAMRSFHGRTQGDEVLIRAGYDLSKKETVKFVDVGGSHGASSIQLAEKHPQLSCVVQDLPSVVAHATKSLPAHLKDRVQFMAHDFWTEQPIKHADIYYFRWIFHDWSDPYAVKILQQTIPALKPGARIIINDACIPPRGVLSPNQEMALRASDITMKALTNAKERDGHAWSKLFEQASPDFHFLGIVPPLPGERLSIIQAEWKPKQTA